MANRPLVLPETYSGEGEFSEWIVHFENVAAVNGWSEEAKLVWLKVRLTGRAQTAYQHLPRDARTSYEESKKALTNRFEPASRKARYQAEFHSRRKRRSEAWADYAEDLRTLCDKAFPDLQEEAREQLSLQKYLEQLDQPQVAFAVKQRVPKSLDEAVTATLEMESYALPERMAKLGIAPVDEPVEPETSVAAVGHRNVTTAEVLERLFKRMEKLEADAAKRSELEQRQRRRWRGQWRGGEGGRRRVMTCWNCGATGHTRRECLARRSPSPQGN